MRGELTTLSGPGQQNAVLNPQGLSDFDAGLIFFAALTRRFPAMTWRDFYNLGSGSENMSGWLTDLGHSLASATRTVVDIVGGAAGDAVRLATDQQVLDGVVRAGEAVATDGASEGARSATSALSSIFTPTQKQTVTAAGQVFKAEAGGMSINWKNPIVIGGAIVLGGVTLLSFGSFLLRERK